VGGPTLAGDGVSPLPRAATMMGMARPQFSLLRLMGAVTCFAVAFGAWSIGSNWPNIPAPVGLLLFLLVTALPSVASGLLSGRAWVGLLVVFATILLHMIAMTLPGFHGPNP